METKPEYYNEFNPDAAAWIRDLIKAGQLPEGDVDERSITDVRPEDLRKYHRAHFFAGIGLWPLSLRLAGFPDDQPLWTGSCPCQPFSSAGKQKGQEDERHLWPTWNRLIEECRPPIIFGEQVAAAIGKGWLDLVQSDLERAGYAIGKAVLGAASVGAPHIRQRLYFVADSECGTSERRGFDLGATPSRIERETSEWERVWLDPGSSQYTLSASALADDAESRLEGRIGGESDQSRCIPESGRLLPFGNMAYDPRCGCGEERENSRGSVEGNTTQGWSTGFEFGSNSVSSELDNSASVYRLRSGAGRSSEEGRQQEPRLAGKLSEGLEGSMSHGVAQGDTYSNRSETGVSEPRPRPEGFSEEPNHGSDRSGRGAGGDGILGVTQGDAHNTGPQGRVLYSECEGELSSGQASLGIPTNGFWRDADWIWCRDLKYRPVEPGTFPLAYGLPRSLGSLPDDLQGLAELAGLSKQSLLAAKRFRKSALHGYGNTISPQVAVEFISAYMETRDAL